MILIFLGLCVILFSTVLWGIPILSQSLNNTGSIAGMYQTLWDGFRKTCSKPLFWGCNALAAWLIIIGFVKGA
jgi:hypothetical protein